MTLRLRRSTTYYRYLFSYVAILLTAVIALVIFSQAFFVVQLRRNLEDAHRSRLRQTVQQLDSSIEQIYMIDYQISSVNENFLSYYLDTPSPMRDLRIVNEFRNLLAPSTFIAEIALVEDTADNVYTSTAVYAKRLFFNSIFSFENWADPANDIQTLPGRIVRPADRVNGSDRYITFINSPSVFSRLQDAALLFFVREDYFLSSLSPAATPSQQGAIWDGAGNLIASTLPLSGPVNEARLQIGSTDYLVLTETSGVMDWTYAFFLPAGEYLAPIHRAQVVLLVFLLSTLVLGALVIHYAMIVNYKPLSELTMALGAAPTDDVVESLRDAIGSLSAQNEHMRSQLMCSPDGQALKDALLFSLLKGKFDSFEAFNAEARPLGMTIDKPWYQVLMLRLFDQETEVPRQTLSDALKECLGPEFPCHFRELFEPSTIVCMVSMNEGAEAELTRRCQHLLETCLERYGLSITIGMSAPSQDVKRITAACFEATQAVREHFIRGRHQLIRYSELRRTLPEQSEHLNMLSGLTSQTPQQQRQTVEHFVALLKEEKIPSLLAKSYCNSAVQQLISSASAQVDMEDLFTITYLRTADDYLAFMLHLLDADPEPIPTPVQSPEEPLPELLSRIYAYIGENYDDCSFSIQETADQLELSGSYLSQYFKQQTGDTLTGYVADLRIRKACTLLETTTMPLQMISESVGYYNQNSFIRRFKQITGVTPGEYRRTHQ